MGAPARLQGQLDVPAGTPADDVAPPVARSARVPAADRRPGNGGTELQPNGFQSSTPLWYYVRKEAELVADGVHLRPVGGRIVAEVLIGPLESDPASYLVQKPKWTPTLTSAERRSG